LHSQAAIIYRKPNAECALLGEKPSKAKIQLKILCNARSEAFDFLGLSALMLRSNNKSSTTNNRKEIASMETLTVDKTQQKTMQQPILVPPGGGEKLNIAGSPISHKVKSKDTNGVFSVMEFVTPPGKGVALHVHEREDELVYLLEGEIEVTLGDQKMKAVPGVMALLPRGIPHGFTNVGNKPSRLLDTILPGQFDNYFVELAGLFTRGEPSQEQNDALSRKYRIKYL
jgi:quercetin dioxygenase-like cupin family protein